MDCYEREYLEYILRKQQKRQQQQTQIKINNKNDKKLDKDKIIK